MPELMRVPPVCLAPLPQLGRPLLPQPRPPLTDHFPAGAILRLPPASRDPPARQFARRRERRVAGTVDSFAVGLDGVALPRRPPRPPRAVGSRAVAVALWRPARLLLLLTSL